MQKNKKIYQIVQWKAQQLENKKLYSDYYYTDHDFVFTNQDGSPINPKRLSTQINRLSKRLNIPIRFHDLRHIHSTMLLEADVNIKVIQQRLEHNDISTTLNVYSHLTPKLEEAAINKFEEKFNL